ncbi:MAG: 3-oxoacyl-ACP reductase FabG [Calditrichaeota bacterium]|nr:3-oxoacyl-ACP reductase FabG [Calditrichota bacterium]
MIRLEGKVALITGASRGIGFATARLMSEAGATVVLNYNRTKGPAEELAQQIKRSGGKALAVKANVADRGEVEAMVDTVIREFERIDILVNNAGIWTYGEIDTMPDEVWDETMDINLRGVFYCTRAVVPHMKRQGGGRIINLSSTAGQRGEAFHSHYAATKGAIISFTKSLAVELAPHNILVNAVAPGWVDTEMSAEALEQEGDKITSIIPLRRPGKAEEIAGPILFLASDLASYMTGEIVNVNGGNVLCG